MEEKIYDRQVGIKDLSPGTGFSKVLVNCRAES